MPISRILHVIVLLALSAASALAQPRFKVDPSTETLVEGGTVNILAIQTDNRRFSLRVPKNYGADVHQSDLSIVFTAQSGASVITLRMSTNYAKALPKDEELRNQVARKFPGASVGAPTTCVTSYATGVVYDLFQPVPGNLTMHMRDAYVSFPEGSFEFTMSCDSRNYDANRLSFAWLLNSFRSLSDSARINP